MSLAHQKVLVVALGLIAAAEITAGSNYWIDVAACVFALIGGLIVQAMKKSTGSINGWMLLAELLASASVGFIIHAVSYEQIESWRILMSLCLLGGMTGTAGLRRMGEKLLPDWVTVDEDVDDKAELED